MGVYELMWGVAILILLGGLAWGVSRYHSRNRANDQAGEDATREIYDRPGGYDEKRARLKRDIR